MSLSFRFLLLISLTVSLSARLSAQECVLKVGAWESNPEEVTASGGTLHTRKGTVLKFTATAVNKRTGRSYSGVYLLGNAYFEEIPQGDYSITVKKPGFKTTVQEHHFSCDSVRNGFDFLDILVVRGNPSDIVTRGRTNTIPPRDPDRFTVIGDPDNRMSEKPVQKETPKQIADDVLIGKALVLPRPAYPPAARVVRAGGSVSVQVVIDEEGNVVSARPVSGHPLLMSAAKAAALRAKFSPTLLQGSPVKVSGVITYNFVPPPEKLDQ